MFLLGLGVSGIVSCIQSLSRTNDWIETTGIVTEVRGGGDSVSTSIRFWDSDGFEHTFRSSFGSSSTGEGDSVELKYPLRNPSHAQTSDDTSQDTAVGFFFGATLVAFAFGLGFRTLGFSFKKPDDLTKVKGIGPQLMVSNRRGVEALAEGYDGQARWALLHLADCFWRADERGLGVKWVYELVEHDEIEVRPYSGVIGHTAEMQDQVWTPRGFVNEFLLHDTRTD